MKAMTAVEIATHLMMIGQFMKINSELIAVTRIKMNFAISIKSSDAKNRLLHVAWVFPVPRPFLLDFQNTN